MKLNLTNMVQKQDPFDLFLIDLNLKIPVPGTIYRIKIRQKKVKNNFI